MQELATIEVCHRACSVLIVIPPRTYRQPNSWPQTYWAWFCFCVMFCFTNTHIHAVFPIGQTPLGSSTCQGGATTHVHMQPSLLDRPHLAGHRVREEPQHIHTCGQLCWPDHTLQVVVSGRSHNTSTLAASPVGQTTLIKVVLNEVDKPGIHMLIDFFAFLIW